MERRDFEEDLSAVSSVSQPFSDPPEGRDKLVLEKNQHSQEDSAVAGIAVIAIGRVGREVLSALSGKLLYLKHSIAIGTAPVALLRAKAGKKLIFSPDSACSFSNGFRRDFEAALDGIDLAFVVADAGRSTNNKLIPVVADVLRARSIPVITAVVPSIIINVRRRKITESDNLAPLRDVSNAVFPIASALRLPARLPCQPTNILNQAIIAFECLYLGVVKPVFGPGLVTVDLEDVVRLLSQKGTSALGFGTASGWDAVRTATLRAITNPLLGRHSLKNASRVFLHLDGDVTHMKCKVIVEMMNVVRRVTGDDSDVELSFAATQISTLSSHCQVTILAGRIDQA